MCECVVGRSWLKLLVGFHHTTERRKLGEQGQELSRRLQALDVSRFQVISWTSFQSLFSLSF